MIRIHFKNGETLETKGSIQELCNILENFNEQTPLKNNMLCFNNKYLVDIRNINYIEEENNEIKN